MQQTFLLTFSQITYSTTKGFKLLNPGYYDNGKVEVDSGRKELALTILQPNMDYEFNITAKTPDDGVTPSSTIYIKTNVAREFFFISYFSLVHFLETVAFLQNFVFSLARLESYCIGCSF